MTPNHRLLQRRLGLDAGTKAATGSADPVLPTLQLLAACRRSQSR